MRAGVPQGSIISPALFNHYVLDCPITNLDMLSYADDFTLLASAPSILEAEARANQLTTTLVLVRQANRKHFPPEFQRDTVHLGYTPVSAPPTMANRRRSGPLNRTPRIVGVTLDSHFTFGLHAPRLYRASFQNHNIMRALAGSSCGSFNWDFGGDIQGHYASHPELCLSHLVQPKSPPPIWTNLRWSRTVPGGPLAVRRPAFTPGRLWFLSFLTSIPDGVLSHHLEPPARGSPLSSFLSPLRFILYGPEVRPSATQHQHRITGIIIISIKLNFNKSMLFTILWKSCENICPVHK